MALPTAANVTGILAFGCLDAVHQLGSAIGAWLPGLAFDATGSYDEVMVAAAIVLAAATAICLALPRPRPTLAPASPSASASA